MFPLWPHVKCTVNNILYTIYIRFIIYKTIYSRVMVDGQQNNIFSLYTIYLYLLCYEFCGNNVGPLKSDDIPTWMYDEEKNNRIIAK